MTPPTAPAEPDFEVLQQAAQWFAVLRGTGVGEDQWQRWEAWRAADGRHAQAWARVESISGRFEQVPTRSKPAAHALLDTAAQRRGERRRSFKMLALLCASAAGAWSVGRVAPWPQWAADHRTGTGERRELALADGSAIWLNTASALDVDSSPTLRRLTLRVGEILVQTAADTALPPRPFVVDTPQGRLQALGTRFAVRRLDDAASLVAVFEGAVEIRPLAGSSRVLQAGEQARFTRAAIDAPTPAEPNRQAWTQGMLLANEMRLADFIDELARHRPGHLACAPEVADLRLVGAYALADTDRVLAALEATLPVRVQRTLPWWVVVGAR